MLDFRRRLTLLGEGDDFAEVLASVRSGRDMLEAGITGGVGSEHAVLVVGVGQGRHDAVGREENRPVEGAELFALFPPGVAIVAHEVLILLEGRIVVTREHLAVCVDVHTLVLGLFQQVLQVAQVVTADEDSRTVAYADVHPCHLGLSVTGGVGCVEQRHGLHAEFTGLHHEVDQLVDRRLAGGDSCQCMLHELMDGLVVVVKTHRMFQIRCHTLQSVDHQLLQRAAVCICFAQYAYSSCFLGIVLAAAVPRQFVDSREGYTQAAGFLDEVVAQHQSAVHASEDALHIEVGVGNG